LLLALAIGIGVILLLAYIACFGAEGGVPDRERLVRFLAARDAELLRMEPIWEPGFPAGYRKTGRNGGYVYRISYVDSEDHIHFAECEIANGGGVQLRRDGIREEDG
jgi:hypothetical protein